MPTERLGVFPIFSSETKDHKGPRVPPDPSVLPTSVFGKDGDSIMMVAMGVPGKVS
jgi:hypothetical protein